MKRIRISMWLAFGSVILLALAACDPMAPQPTPVSVVISPQPSQTPTPQPTATPTETPIPSPTPTPDMRPSSTPFPCDDTSGSIEEFNNFRSEVANGENLRYNVYIPPCYVETRARFPVVYLLHGLSYREQQWQDIGVVDALEQGIRLGALPPMILVMPYYGSIGQRNSFPPDPSYESHILNELMPAVESQFCTWEDRDYRAIGGISRGGFWAYSIAFRHPDVFGIVGGHSAYFPDDIGEIPPPYNPLEIARNSSILPDADLRMYLDNGASDSSASSQQRLSDRLRERSIEHTYVINPIGEHNNEYWSTHVSEYLEFYGKEWPKDFSELPSCTSQ